MASLCYFCLSSISQDSLLFCFRPFIKSQHHLMREKRNPKLSRRRKKLGEKLQEFSTTLDQVASESRFTPAQYSEMKAIVRDLKAAIKDIHFKPATSKRRKQLLDFLTQIGNYTTTGKYLCAPYIVLRILMHSHI